MKSRLAHGVLALNSPHFAGRWELLIGVVAGPEDEESLRNHVLHRVAVSYTHLLGPRWKGPIVIAESSAGSTTEGFKNYHYNELVKDFPGRDIKLVDLNEEGLYETIPLLDGDLHVQMCRLAKRLCDPEAFVISAGLLKTHNVLIATLNIKNMTLGAPLHNASKEKPFNDKRIFHGGVRQTHYDVMLTAQKL